MNVLDLFSGIGGFSLGLERAGMRTVAFCEIDPYCRAVLAKHWPSVPCYTDVRELTAAKLAADGISADIICGGFPCQDISVAGKGAGLSGARSGLWREYARLIGELRPKFVVVENVAALLSRGLAEVLGDLAAIGFDAEWHCIPASAVGATHRRDRIWIIAYPGDGGLGRIFQSQRELWSDHASNAGSNGKALLVANAASERCGEARQHRERPAQRTPSGSEVLGGSDSEGLSRQRAEQIGANWQQIWRLPSATGWWTTEPDVGRVAHGIPSRVDRLKCLGNAVVPKIPEIIGRAIMKANSASALNCGGL
jgi:DNA (cytosine-5)-methyltransferase 1